MVYGLSFGSVRLRKSINGRFALVGGSQENRAKELEMMLAVFARGSDLGCSGAVF
jgi:hypothetical protein